MREYEVTVIYDLAVAEAGGADAPVQLLTSAVEARGGRVLRVDHWGRRRMAYPINKALDGDYVVSRVELEPQEVRAFETSLRIDERVYRHLVVRADELPAPPPPREPRQPEEAPAPSADATPADAPQPETAAAAAAEQAEASAEAAPEPGTASESGSIAETETNA